MIGIEKPKNVEINQWFKNGDHPKDESVIVAGTTKLTEGKIVRKCDASSNPLNKIHKECGKEWEKHGIMKSLNEKGYQYICPGDYIIDYDDGTRIAIHTIEEVNKKYTII